jgi:hypothetical protein
MYGRQNITWLKYILCSILIFGNTDNFYIHLFSTRTEDMLCFKHYAFYVNTVKKTGSFGVLFKGPN